MNGAFNTAGWANCTLGEITEVITKGTTPTTAGFPFVQSGIPFIKVENINVQGIDLKAVTQFITPEAHRSLRRSQFAVGDVLFSIAGTIGKTALVGECHVPANTNQAVAIVRGTPNAFAPKFLLYQLRGASQAISESNARGGAMNNISLGDLKALTLDLPPLPEQKRIADKLDSLLARMGACRERLDRLPMIIKQFRRSVLAAATSGRLTEDWRKDLSSNAVGSRLPATWTTCKIKDAGRIQLGRQRSPKFHSGANMRPYLRVQNVFEDRLDLSDVMAMDFPGADIERYQLHHGDILLNEGQSPQFLGRPAMYRGELPGACFTNTLIRFQAYPNVKSDFALLVFRHHMHSGRYSDEGTITTNIAHLGAGRFGEVEFPLPPMAEQTEIVRRAEHLFAIADRLEARVRTARSKIDTLTPATLAKAFRGELVPQDPNDEPASVLLERIRAERAASAVARPRSKRRGAS